jgi:Zn-dependent M28 family amino/carboxypeptidase
VATAHGVKVTKDPEPNRMGFVRSDQYSFIREGVPALAFKFGYEKGSKEEALFKKWRSDHYHAPSDDLRQPLDKEGAAKFVRLLADLARTVADAPERPRWNGASFFRRFEKPAAP